MNYTGNSDFKSRLIFTVGSLVVLSAVGCCAASFARNGNTVVAGNARFQVLESAIIRMELAPDGQFVDVASAIVPKREWPPSKFRVTEKDGWLVINTGRAELKYRLGSDAFDESSLSVTWNGGSWKPGEQDTRNLGGAYWSLDGLPGEPPDLSPLPGPLSRLGWFIMDDSNDPIYDPQTNWIKPREKPGSKDLYILIYGNDYKLGLRQYAALLGAVPMVPRWSLGAWYSRYWPYSDKELTYIVNNFRNRQTPLDILVIDVDWHLHGWEGYDWNPQFFPDPLGFLKWCRDQGLKVTLNNHPGGLPNEESKAPAVRERLGLKPDEGIQFNLARQRDAETYMEVLHNPMIDQGIDFWWIDGCAASMEHLNCMFWTNHVYYTLTQKHLGEARRAFQFSRWGGHGSHRYPCGFSGDTHSHWGVLKKEVALTAMQGNLLWQWSHDIGGFLGDYIGEELYLRWTQFGVFSPFVRFHSNHGRRLPWDYGEKVASLTRDALKLRYRLTPYIYTLYRDLNQNALSICRPLYIEWPHLEEAYQHPYEYLFGRDLLVAPATQPTHMGASNVEVYLPPGTWLDFFTGRVYDGSRNMVYSCPLDRVPVFARAGAIVPMQPDMQYIGEKPVDPLTINIYRGGHGQFELYEDDGVSMAYARGAFATTRMRLKDGRDGFVFQIDGMRGRYDGMPNRRSYVLRVFGASTPRSVLLNGRPMDERMGVLPGWRLEPDSGALEIRLGEHPVRNMLTVEVSNPKGFEAYRWARTAVEIQSRIRSLQPILSEQQRIGFEGWDAMTALDEQLGRDIQAVLNGVKHPYSLGKPLMAVADAVLKDADSNEAARDVAARLLGFGTTLVALDDQGGSGIVVIASASWDDSLRAGIPEIAVSFPEGWEAEETAGSKSYEKRYRVTPPAALPLGRYEVTATAKAKVLARELTFTQVLRRDNSSVTDWKVVGLFDNTDNAGMTTAYGPEKEKTVNTAASYEGLRGAVTWQDVTPNMISGDSLAPKYVDLLAKWPAENVVAYALTYVHSPDERKVRFDIGSDDGIVVWLNGTEIFRHNDRRGATPAQDKLTAQLKQGWNEVLLKIGQLPGGWGFYFEIKTPDGEPVSDLKVATRPES